MEKKNQKIELLSPAGSFDSLYAAMQAGADAIYFGVEQLNMRAKSTPPFSINDIKEVARVCHERNVKCYITLNTVMYDHDRRLMESILKRVKQYGVDAVIASDFAVLQTCREMGIPLHISTQANVSNYTSVQFFAQFADVVVLARELTLKQMQEISTNIKRHQLRGVSGELVKIEVFVHGALCMAVSGKCYLSLHAQNASANRGACIQTCRRAYKVTDAETNEELMVENEYIMSAKDLCTIGILDQVAATGVDVFKIEGRTKGADYVYAVTKCYREALDAIAEGNYTQEKIQGWENELAKVYNRGFWEGYYLGRKMGEWADRSGSAATERKLYVGKGARYYPRIGVAEFVLESANIMAGDQLLVSSPDFGIKKFSLDELVVNGEKAVTAVKGDHITFPFSQKISPADKLYKIVSSNG